MKRSAYFVINQQDLHVKTENIISNNYQIKKIIILRHIGNAINITR